MKLSAAFVLGCILAFLICLETTTTLAQTQGLRSNLSFIDTFRTHWSTAKVLALAVADAMPSESYNFKPVSAEMGFGEQMLHIAQANYGYCAFIADTKSPYADPAKDAKVEKAAAIKDLEGSFDYCTKVFDGLDESRLSQMHGEGKGRFSTLDVMLGVMIHVSHHRGQAEVYLRVKGIVPPEYKW
jgi:uncharacterized damage-inducible protein DinB